MMEMSAENFDKVMTILGKLSDGFKKRGNEELGEAFAMLNEIFADADIYVVEEGGEPW